MMEIINQITGNFGKYQSWLCFIIFANKFGVAFHQMAIIFLAPPVYYRCPDGNLCCNTPVYNKSIFTNTIVMKWNLICEKAWLKNFTQTLFQFGVLAGSLLFGIASDRFGRRPSLIIATIMEVFFGIMSSFLPDFWSFSIIRMILGSSVGGIMVIGFVIVMEYVGSTNRDVISALYQVPFTAGHMLLAAFGYYLRDYVYFQLAISLSTVFLLFYICILPETPRWLLAVDKTLDAVSLLQNVAKINGLPTEEIARKIELYQLEHRSVREKRGTFIDLFKNSNLRKNILVMSFLWFSCSYCFYGVSQYISYLSGDIYIHVLAAGGVCLCGCILSIPLMRIMGRKPLVIIANTCCSFCFLMIAAIPGSIEAVVFSCIGVLFSFIIFVVIYLYCSEMFPTVVRNAAVGISSMMARLGAMIAPFVAELESYGRWQAPVAFGILPLIAALLCVFLPETKDCELMMTIDEDEASVRSLSRQDAINKVTDRI